MTEDRSLERAARSWLENGPTQAPDRAVEAALLRIQTTPQERDLRIPWRFSTMSTPARVATAAVIGVLVVGGAFFILGRPGQSGVGGPGPTATSTQTPTQTPTPTPAALRDGPLAAGTYVTAFTTEGWTTCPNPDAPDCNDPVVTEPVRFTFTVPDGWARLENVIWLAKEQSGAPSGASFVFGPGNWLYSDPCLTPENDTGADTPVGPTVDDLATALAEHPLLDTTDPVDVTLDGFSGKYIDLQVPADISACTRSYSPIGSWNYAQGPANRWHLWILDVNGQRVMVHSSDYATTSAKHQAELRAIVESIKIGP
jgi:hypothetical protein